MLILQIELGLPINSPFIKIINKNLIKAFIDLGTNTFHCKIVSIQNRLYKEIYYEKIFVKIGEGGISKGFITEKAIKRASNALEQFQEVINKYDVNKVIATGTSAMRNANNASVLIDLMLKWNWKVEIINGNREAELIYKGILLDHHIPHNSMSLIMDIGGGSVEFIIGEGEEIKWSQSFEIGAQRLKDQFHNNDPISDHDIKSLKKHLEQSLKSLKIALEKFKPEIFIGSSGTFDTILSIRNEKNNLTSNLVSVSEFQEIKTKLTQSPFEERLIFPGMEVERAEMIVTASLLLDYVLKLVSIPKFFVSSNALKEGLIYEEIHRKKP